jgi:hypothetical protein
VLAILVVLNVVLLTALFVRQTGTGAVIVGAPPTLAVPTAQPSGSTRTAFPSPRPEASASPSATPEPEAPHPSSTPRATEPRRLMAANSARVAWRAAEGTCSKRARVEVTTDGGRTWRKTDPGVRGLVRLRAYGETSVFAVGADKNCKPTYAWTSSPRGNWRQDSSIIFDVWFRYPDDKDLVHAPGGRKFRPCGSDLVAFAGIGTYQAAGLCGDGRIRTIAAGRGWQTVLAGSGAVTLNADDAAFTAARVLPGCDGLVVQRFSAAGRGLSRSNEGCRPGPTDGSPVGVATDGDRVWLWR